MKSLFEMLVIDPLREDAKAVSEGRKPEKLNNSFEILERTLNEIPDESMSCMKSDEVRT